MQRKGSFDYMGEIQSSERSDRRALQNFFKCADQIVRAPSSGSMVGLAAAIFLRIPLLIRIGYRATLTDRTIAYFPAAKAEHGNDDVSIGSWAVPETQAGTDWAGRAIVVTASPYLLTALIK